MVPNEWLKTNFGAVTEIANGQVDPKVEPYLSMLHIGPENVVSDSGQIINVVTCKESSLISGKYEFDENAIVYSKIRPNLNKVCRPRFKGVCSADMYPIWAKDELDIEFLLHYMLGPQFYKVAVAMSMRTGMPKINRNDLNTVTLLLPPVGEQKKIAQILSTWDQAIATTERLLDLARQQKKALMQQLLTGKKRFPEFKDAWKKVKLSSVAEMNSGGTPKSSVDEYFGGEIPWVSIADMTKHGKWIETTEKTLTQLGLKNSAARLYPPNTILYAMYASIGECSIAKRELSSSQAILGIRPKPTLRYEFLYFYLVSLKDKIKLQGQQGTQANLNAGMVKDFTIHLPSIEEQQKIADILNAADQEIETLQSQLDGLKQEKKALMQALLTGKRRVSVDK